MLHTSIRGSDEARWADRSCGRRSSISLRDNSWSGTLNLPSIKATTYLPFVTRTCSLNVYSRENLTFLAERIIHARNYAIVSRRFRAHLCRGAKVRMLNLEGFCVRARGMELTFSGENFHFFSARTFHRESLIVNAKLSDRCTLNAISIGVKFGLNEE